MPGTCAPGCGIVFDAVRYLHFGARGNRYERLVLTFYYMPLDAPTETRYHIDSPLELLDEPQLSKLQRLARELI